MTKKSAENCCGPGEMCGCKVESVVTVDYRGQMVLPKEIRDKAKIKAGDKLALVSWQMNGEICCITLMKADGFEEMVKDMLGPMMKHMTSK